MHLRLPRDHPAGAIGPPIDELRRRMPPLGWRGEDCACGEMVTESERMAVVVDRVRAFPTGVEILLAFHTADQDLMSRIQGFPTRDEMRADMMRRAQASRERSSTDAPDRPPTFMAWSRLIPVRPSRVPGRNPIITVSMGSRPEVSPLDLHHEQLPQQDARPVFERSWRTHDSPGAVVALWISPLPGEDTLTVSVQWAEEGLAPGTVTLDMAVVRAAAPKARELYSVDFVDTDI